MLYICKIYNVNITCNIYSMEYFAYVILFEKFIHLFTFDLQDCHLNHVIRYDYFKYIFIYNCKL